MRTQTVVLLGLFAFAGGMLLRRKKKGKATSQYPANALLPGEHTVRVGTAVTLAERVDAPAEGVEVEYVDDPFNVDYTVNYEGVFIEFTPHKPGTYKLTSGAKKWTIIVTNI